MRADRLLSILLLLQKRTKITASEMAQELEVSVRTIYRDMDALSAAGIPVFIERGPGGGCSLLEGYQTRLTGLNKDEVKALFLLSVPASLEALGVSRDLKTALDKLAAALPLPQRQDEQMVHQRVYMDWSERTAVPTPSSFLPLIHRSIWDKRRLALTYYAIMGSQGRLQFERQVEPYGLVARAGEWYLAAAESSQTGDGRIKVYRTSHLLKAVTLDECFERPADFNLALFWKEHCAVAMKRPQYAVTLRISSALAARLPILAASPDALFSLTNDRLNLNSPRDKNNYLQTTLVFENFEEARRQILAFGRAAEVLEPAALRESVIDYACQIVAFYSG